MSKKKSSKKRKGDLQLHPVLARAQEGEGSMDHQLTTLTEKELQERIKANRKKAKAEKRNVKRVENDKTFSPVQGVVGVLMILALGWWALGELQSDNGAITMQHYVIARGVLLFSMYVLVLVTAFKMSFPQGFMCVIFPPYILYFVAIPMESSALKGMLLGLVAVFVMEHKQLGKDSCYTIAAKNYEKITAQGRNLLNVGSDQKYYQ